MPTITLDHLRRLAPNARSSYRTAFGGRIYKGQCRLRLLYARIPNECVLMGQEVLEYADL